MAARMQYQIVGRYMNGKEVTGYHLQSIGNNKAGKYTREQVCYLVGRDQVTNCSGQLYQDKVLLRGVGVSLEDLPVQQESGEVSRTEAAGKIRRDDKASDIMTKLNLTHAIVSGRNTIGYIVTNVGGGTHKLTREQLLTLAKQGKIGNARYQESNGKPILRGVGINLNELPTVTAESVGITVPTQAKAPAEVKKPVQAAPAAPATPATPAAPAAPAAPKKAVQASDKKPIDKVEQFRELCVKTTNAVKNKFRAVNGEGFWGPDEDDDEYVERFDFSIGGKNQNHGGFITLANDMENVTFNILDGYGGTETFTAKNTHLGLTGGWGSALKILNRAGSINSWATKRENGNSIKSEDMEAVRFFKDTLGKTFVKANNSSNIDNRLNSGGYFRNDGFVNNELDKMGIIDRFEFNVAGTNGTGAMTLKSAANGQYKIVSEYSAESGSDSKEFKVSSRGIYDGLAWILKGLTDCGVI